MEIQGLILAGGQASRMGGVDKGLQLWNDQWLVRYPLKALEGLCGGILISCNRNLDRYLTLVDEIVEDQASDYQGPLSGLVSAIERIRAEWLLVSPCDTPLVTTSDFEQLLQAATQAPDHHLFALSDDEKSHPLHCLIHRSLFSEITAAFNDGERSVFRVFKRLGVIWVETDKAHMRNVNALEQLN
ncbi:molybdenum cofactor guanylyltransferase MobA [Litoribrevibacter albus]|nr:molybdenum cofactor guanylyltransferase MobA [Litoribrevibacter albus]